MNICNSKNVRLIGCALVLLASSGLWGGSWFSTESKSSGPDRSAPEDSTPAQTANSPIDAQATTPTEALLMAADKLIADEAAANEAEATGNQQERPKGDREIKRQVYQARMERADKQDDV